jgi:hypothetical protein
MPALKLPGAFAKRSEEAYTALAEMRGMGSPGKVRQGRHADLRIWPIRDFSSYLVAYRPHKVGVAIERLIHARQDYQRVLK